MRLRERMRARTLTVEEGRIVARASSATADRQEEEAAFHAAVERAVSARALLPADPAPGAMLADLYLEKLRDSVLRKDRAGERSWARLVAENDAAGVHRAELEGRGTVAFEVVPEGAEVHLFRYEEQADFVSGGERRLVPVPIDGAPTPVPPGTWCVRCVEARDGFEPEDQIIEIGGRPIEGMLLVGSTDRPGLEPLDRLVSVDGHLVDRFEQVSWRMKYPEGTASRRTLVFERGGRELTVEAASLNELRVKFENPRSLIHVQDVEGVVWHRGETRKVVIPEGLEARTTAAPLFLSPQSCVGRSPVPKRALLPGSYLAWVSQPGSEPQRLPFVVGRGADVVVSARLRPAGQLPRHFRYVPAGPAIVGRPNAVGRGALPEEIRHVPSFAISEREVTAAEFVEFLNSPGVDDELTRMPDQMEPSRVSGMSMWSWIKRGPDGKLEVDRPFRDHPANGVTFEAAQAYARWRTAEAAAGARPVQYALPTDVEWEKAARGADGRNFTYGDTYHALWQKGGRSSMFMRTEIVASHPVDESPFGLYDLSGGISEWCERSEASVPGDERTLRGIPWSDREEHPLSEEKPMPPGSTRAEAGFRLVIRDLERDSRPSTR